jgi:zinc/manganese transport system substrate-binding protein
MNNLTAPLVAALLLAAAPAQAAVRVVTTLTDLAWATREVGGDLVEVRSLCAPNEDPHYVTPTPSLIAAVGDADLFVEVGLNLELWTERLLDGAGNPKVRAGGPGYVLASAGIDALGRPTTLSRSQGDLHPDGNPHIWLDPVEMEVVVDNIAAGLARVDAAHADTYRARAAALKERIDAALVGEDLVRMLGAALLERLLRSGQLETYLDKEIGGAPLRASLGGWLGRMQAMKGRSVIYFHESWAYFDARFGVSVAGYVEEKPGVPPSAAHRKRIEAVARDRQVPVILVANFYDDRVAGKLAADLGIPLAVVPLMTGGTKEATTWFDLMDVLVAAHLRGSK